MFGGMFFAVVVMVLCVAAVMILERDDGESLFDTSRVKNEQWESAVLAGISIALICIFYVKALWLAIVCYAVLIMFNIVLAKWWHEEGSDFFEILPFILLACVFYNIEGTIAEKIAVRVSNEFLSSVLTTAPLVILIITIGYFVVEVFRFRARMEQKGE